MPHAHHAMCPARARVPPSHFYATGNKHCRNPNHFANHHPSSSSHPPSLPHSIMNQNRFLPAPLVIVVLKKMWSCGVEATAPPRAVAAFTVGFRCLPLPPSVGNTDPYFTASLYPSKMTGFLYEGLLKHHQGLSFGVQGWTKPQKAGFDNRKY